ncbi:MAG: hypothetical protein H0X38_09775 [Planctomycetes bacterium]|nr:hypothetical protein [Planctomycetota bacterium]
MAGIASTRATTHSPSPSAFILTRPLGATIGDLLDKPNDHGGLELSRYTASAVLAAIIIAGVLFLPRRPRRPRSDAVERSPDARGSRSSAACTTAVMLSTGAPEGLDP